MWDAWLNQSTLPALEQTAVFAQNRQSLLAGNIANLDVPGYKTRDISTSDFQERLKEMLTAQSNPSSGAIPGEAPSKVPAEERVRDVSRQILYQDGSDVSLEEQITQISKNESMHNMAIALMRSQFQNLQVAIRESVSV
jgi:flagellar basal-body rod protein FlgB